MLAMSATPTANTAIGSGPSSWDTFASTNGLHSGKSRRSRLRQSSIASLDAVHPLISKGHDAWESDNGGEGKPAILLTTSQKRRASRIVQQPTVRMSDEDKIFVWSMREKLVSDRRALTKFLHAVDWQDAAQVSQAAKLLSQWEHIDIVTGVRLLAGDAAEHKSEIVRKHAIGALSVAPEETLRLYLLQLVQALRYDTDSSIYKSSSSPTMDVAAVIDAVERLGDALEAQGDLRKIDYHSTGKNREEKSRVRLRNFSFAEPSNRSTLPLNFTGCLHLKWLATQERAHVLQTCIVHFYLRSSSREDALA